MTAPANDAVFTNPNGEAEQRLQRNPETLERVVNADVSTAVEVAVETPVELTKEETDLARFYDALNAWRERLDSGWPYERIDYKGDSLAVRKPQMQALAAFQLSSSKFISDERKNDIVGLFVDQHMGRESYDHVMGRLMNPDDPDYTTESIADVMGKLVELAVEDIKEEAKSAVKKA